MVEFAVILAVGSSLHQSQLAYNRPRAMLPVLGKPIVVRTMERLYRAGVHRYVVVVGEDEGAVAAYLNTQWLPNVQIEFAVQMVSSSLTRTLADIARRYAQPFLIATYNSFTQTNFPERLLKHYQDLGDGLILSGAPMTLSRSKPPAYALVDDHRVTAILREKPPERVYSLALTNLAICGDSVIQYLSGLVMNTGVFSKQLIDVLNFYVHAGGSTWMTEAAWILQVEADYDLLTLNKHLLSEQQDAHILSDLPATVQIIPPVRIDPQVSIGQWARIGPHVYLEAGCSVGHHAAISNAVVLQNAVIPAGNQISDTIVASRIRIDDPEK